MPHYVPTELCLDSIYARLRDEHLLDLSGNELLEQMDCLAQGTWPFSIKEVCPGLEEKRVSTALAIALAILWPPGMWHAEEAQREFDRVAAGLPETVSLRQTVDHATVCAVRVRWAPAYRLLTSSILGDIEKYRGPVGTAIRFLRGYPVHGQLDGLIPDLDRCWGHAFTNDGNGHVADLMHRLLKPVVSFQPKPGSEVEFTWEDNQVVVKPFSKEPVPAGSRRNYRLAEGAGELFKNEKHDSWVGTGQRLILRVFDDGEAELQIAYPKGGNVGGHKLKFKSGDDLRLRFTAEADSEFESWNCTCGALDCDKSHRLEAWDPLTMPAKMTLASFLGTAIKGPSNSLKIKVFIQGMYYALLCDGG
jgi:hypothetical protein